MLLRISIGQKAEPAKPTGIIAQVDGSGTTELDLAVNSIW
jgi:hypothetical protein